MTSDDDTPHMTEADRVSQTRFGPRPVPKGHTAAGSSPHRPMRSSRVIPSAPLSPDGRRPYPTPALLSKVIVWGGVALGVAGVTAGTLLATRKLAGAIADDRPDRPVPPTLAVKPAATQPRDMSTAGLHPKATSSARRAVPQRNIARDLTDTANDLSASLNGVAQSLIGAFDGFQRVATQARGIMAEFSLAADQVRSVMGSSPAHPRPEAPPMREDDENRRHGL